MRREVISAEKTPQAIGPYVQAIKLDGWIYASGQIPPDPRTDALVDGGILTQTRQVIENLAAVLAAAGTSLTKALRTTVSLTNLGDFQKMNEVYAEYFREEKPVRSMVGAATLPRGALVEIDVIAQA